MLRLRAAIHGTKGGTLRKRLGRAARLRIFGEGDASNAPLVSTGDVVFADQQRAPVGRLRKRRLSPATRRGPLLIAISAWPAPFIKEWYMREAFAPCRPAFRSAPRGLLRPPADRSARIARARRQPRLRRGHRRENTTRREHPASPSPPRLDYTRRFRRRASPSSVRGGRNRGGRWRALRENGRSPFEHR